MFCDKCGKQANDNDVFCTGCGNKITKPCAPSPEKIQNEIEIKYAAVHKQKSNKGIIIAICACLAVLLVAVTITIIMALNTGSDDVDTKSKNHDSSKSYSENYKKAKKTPMNNTHEKTTNAKERTELVIGYTYNAPLSYYKDGVLTGFDIELAQYVCNELGLTPVFKEILWDEKEILLQSEKIDCVWNGLSYTAERDKTMSLSQVYADNYYYNSEHEMTSCDSMVIGFKKGSDLTEKVDKIISEAKENGTIDAIKQKHLFYRVKLSENDSDSQIGAFIDFNRAKDLADSKAGQGYEVYNSLNILVYEP